MKRHRGKSPAFERAPPFAKTPAIARDPDAGSRSPLWRLHLVDLDGPFGWNNATAENLRQILEKLRHYESMTWREIETNDKTGCHSIPSADLAREAGKRLVEIQQDDAADLYSLRITGQHRVWGVRDRSVLKILWWDPEHMVYPTPKRNT